MAWVVSFIVSVSYAKSMGIAICKQKSIWNGHSIKTDMAKGYLALSSSKEPESRFCRSMA
jgi:hypothetical protein